MDIRFTIYIRLYYVNRVSRFTEIRKKYIYKLIIIIKKQTLYDFKMFLQGFAKFEMLYIYTF